MWVHAALPPRTLREFVDYAAARPGALNYATGGVGSSNHVDVAWFSRVAGLDLVHIPYNGPAAMPAVPTAAEQGSGALDLAAWIGLMAPAGTPEPILDRLDAAVAQILRQPDTVDWAGRHGMEIAGGSRAEFARTLERDSAHWGDVVGRLRIRPD